MTNWHQLDRESVLAELTTSEASGLSGIEAVRRLVEYGRNELAGNDGRSPWRIVWEQLTALLMVVLAAAALVALMLGDYLDAAAIGTIVILNATLGFLQEYRAEKAIAALKKLAVPPVRVRRDGTVQQIEAARLVPGDIVLLEAGNSVAADCRLLQSASLKTHEAALTGESEPIQKTAETLAPGDCAIGDRRNMVYLGTFVTSGRGEAVVIGTGMRTELGRIAALIHTVEPEATPLQRRLDHLGRILAAAALFVVALIFLLGYLRGEAPKLLFLTAVSIGVAAVPEGLPAVVTIALALGARRMLQRRALIRKLSAVETLGSVTVICSDKTGTLTENRMTVAALQLLDDGMLILESDDGGERGVQRFRPLLAIGALCNDVRMPAAPAGAETIAPSGDPTEVALAVAASRFGFSKSELEQFFPRVAEIPFSSERRRMTTIHGVRPNSGKRLPFEIGLERSPYVAFVKGAVESLLETCSFVWTSGRAEPLDQPARDRLVASHESLAKQGMRVLGMAFRGLESLPETSDLDIGRGLTFAGMVGMMDPPRREALLAVAKCQAAGIRPVMITGDHPLTAQSIAGRVGISNEAAVVTGTQLERLSAAGLEAVVASAQVYARVSPEHKLRIVEGLQRGGHVVAMTGDGVNDAPALKTADIGVAMGKAGTDVAREAADMVLLDDNFATVVAAVEEGRVIYDNVRKFVRYTLTTNSGEICVMLAAPMIGMPLPLLPLQILWMNLVTDGLPALALSAEPPEASLMRRPPRRPSENLFAGGMGRHVIWVGLLMGLLSLAAGYCYWSRGDPNWQTVLFTTLTLSQMAHVMAIRSERQSLFQIGVLSNLPLLAAVCLTVLLQLALMYIPFLQLIFHTRGLPFEDLAASFGVSSIVFVAVELEKLVLRKREPLADKPSL